MLNPEKLGQDLAPTLRKRNRFGVSSDSGGFFIPSLQEIQRFWRYAFDKHPGPHSIEVLTSVGSLERARHDRRLLTSDAELHLHSRLGLEEFTTDDIRRAVNWLLCIIFNTLMYPLEKSFEHGKVISAERALDQAYWYAVIHNPEAQRLLHNPQELDRLRRLSPDCVVAVENHISRGSVEGSRRSVKALRRLGIQSAPVFDLYHALAEYALDLPGKKITSTNFDTLWRKTLEELCVTLQQLGPAIIHIPYGLQEDDSLSLKWTTPKHLLPLAHIMDTYQCYPVVEFQPSKFLKRIHGNPLADQPAINQARQAVSLLSEVGILR